MTPQETDQKQKRRALARRFCLLWSVAFPGRCAARSVSLLSRGPFCRPARPGSAERHYMTHRVRDTKVEINYPGSSAASATATDASACAVPWPRSGEYVRGSRELLADFFQRMVRVHADAEAHAEHAFFARRQRGQHPRGGFAQVGLKIAKEPLSLETPSVTRRIHTSAISSRTRTRSCRSMRRSSPTCAKPPRGCWPRSPRAKNACSACASASA